LNKVEVFFYDLVKANPRLKVQIRNVYQRLFDLVPAKRMATAYEIEARRGFFFGFHDKCPWSVDDKCPARPSRHRPFSNAPARR
jgi:hypothetical protein